MEMAALMLSALLWVCGNSHFECDERVLNNLPQVELVEYGELHKMVSGEEYAGGGAEYLALYDSVLNKVLVDEGFQETVPGLTLEEILVHEAVHALQNLTGPVPACMVAAEVEAYDIQIDWQRQMGKPAWLNGLWLLMLKEEGC